MLFVSFAFVELAVGAKLSLLMAHLRRGNVRPIVSMQQHLDSKSSVRWFIFAIAYVLCLQRRRNTLACVAWKARIIATTLTVDD